MKNKKQLFIYTSTYTMILRTIYILRWRQVKVFFGKKARVLGSLGQPLLLFVALGMWLRWVFEAAGQWDSLVFLAAGIVAMTTMMSSVFGGVDVIWDKERGFMKEVLASPARRIWIMIGRMLGGATAGVFQGMLVFVLTLFIGVDRSLVVSVPMALVYIVLIALMFTAFWLILGSLINDFQVFQLLMNFLIMPIVFLSGAFYPLDTTGSALQRIARINPLAYGVDGIRWALTWEYFFHWSVSLVIMFGLLLCFVWAGAYFFGRMKPDND